MALIAAHLNAEITDRDDDSVALGIVSLIPPERNSNNNNGT